MADAASDAAAAGRTAVLVINTGSHPLLCPFFSKCDGALLVDAAGNSREFHPRDRSGAKPVCDLLLELKPGKIICGFIDQPARRRLRAAGIDVRLGACNCPIDELVNSFGTLPPA